MEKNIFENVKFGDKFVTGDGRICVFLRKVKDEFAEVLFENEYNNNLPKPTLCHLYTNDEYNSGQLHPNKTLSVNIVGRYKEQIDENALREKAYEWTNFVKSNDLAVKVVALESAMIGYRKAKEEK